MKFTSKNYPNFETTKKIWGKFETEISIEFDKDLNLSKEEQEKYFQQIEEKLHWIEENKELILDTFIQEEGMFDGLNNEIEEQITKKGIAKLDNNLTFTKPLTEEEYKEAIGICFLNFFVDKEEINCDFDLDAEPDYFFGHLANIELYGNEIIMGGING